MRLLVGRSRGESPRKFAIFAENGITCYTKKVGFISDSGLNIKYKFLNGVLGVSPNKHNAKRNGGHFLRNVTHFAVLAILANTKNG